MLTLLDDGAPPATTITPEQQRAWDAYMRARARLLTPRPRCKVIQFPRRPRTLPEAIFSTGPL